MLRSGTTRIRQLDIETGIQMYIYSSEDAGSEPAVIPISLAGSEFELWADIQGVLTYLDNMQVGGLPPTALFTITTQDPWVGSETVTVAGQTVTQDIFRTRADLSFSTTAVVGSLSTDPTAPALARQLNLFYEGNSASFDWSIMDYPYGVTYSIATDVVDNFNNTYSWSGLSRLTGFTDPTAKVGVERVNVQTLGGTWTSPDGTTTAVVNPWDGGFCVCHCVASGQWIFHPDEPGSR